jgi:peptidoglycan/LPS O-acetylase OafA/YrhL
MTSTPFAGPTSLERKSSQRFVTLDALRGVGALTVMAGHAGVILGGYSPRFMYLSVDMFFVLSGFVLAHAYDDKFRRGLTTSAFLWARVRRLYPIYLVGLVLGLISLAFSNVHGLSGLQLALSLLCNLFALPSPPVGVIKPLFPVNGPFWSLFFEFWVANLMFGLLWRFLHGKWLLVLIAVSGAVLAFLGLHVGRLDFGWTWHQFVGGIVRVCFSFFAGVALSRLHASRPSSFKVPSVLCLAVFAIAVLLPVSGAWKVFYELGVVLLLFPALIYFGAGATEPHPQLGRFLGDSSYATYAIHRPLLYILSAPLGALALAPSRGMALCIEAALMLLITGLALLVNAVVTPRKPSAGRIVAPASAGGET